MADNNEQKKELEQLAKEIDNIDGDIQKTIDIMYQVSEAIEHYGLEPVQQYIDVDEFYKNIGRKAAELEVDSILNNKPELGKFVTELTADKAWDREWQHVGRNICLGQDDYLKDHPEVVVNEKGQIVPTPPAPPEPQKSDLDPSVLIIKREGAFEHFNPMAMTDEQIEIIGRAQAEHEKTYTPLKPLEIGPPPPKEMAITDIKLAAEALRNAHGDKEVAEVLSKLGKNIRNDSKHMVELIEINPQAYNATSTMCRNLTPFFKALAIEAHPRVYDFLSEKDQQKLEGVYTVGVIKNMSHLDKMQKILTQTPDKENKIYAPLYDKHPNCSNKRFYGSNHGSKYQLMVRNRDAFLEHSPFGQKLYFQGPRGHDNLANPVDVRNIVVPDKGLILGPANIALCASHIQNPYKNMTRTWDERHALEIIGTEMMMNKMSGPQLHNYHRDEYYKKEIHNPIYEYSMPLLYDTSKEGKQWRQELKEAFAQKSPYKFEARYLSHVLDRCEHKGKVQVCKTLRHDLNVPARAERRRDFTFGDAVAVEVYPVRPRDMVKAMIEAGPELLDKYVSPKEQAEYWKVWSQEIASEQIFQSHSPYGVHPQTRQENEFLDKVCKQFPHVAPAIQEGRAAAERSYSAYQQEVAHEKASQQFEFFKGEEAFQKPDKNNALDNQNVPNREEREGR